MTRETKIGLLVGLAFIIVIGILLADYNANSMRPSQALMVGRENVLESSRSPGKPLKATAPFSVSPTELSQPMVTPADPANADRRNTVTVNPSRGNARRIDIGDESQQPVIPPGDNTTRNPTPLPPGNETAEKDSGGLDTNPHGSEYKAKPGDTVSKMAARLPGGNNAANREAIIKANESLKGNPNKVIAGETYILPLLASDRGSSSNNNSATPSAPTKEVSYTTKAGDNLWKIAVDQCGSGSLVNKIKEMNRDVLKGSDVLHPNMTLKLPPKTLASAN